MLTLSLCFPWGKRTILVNLVICYEIVLCQKTKQDNKLQKKAVQRLAKQDAWKGVG